MVNFDNDNTIGTPAIDIVRVLVLEKRTNIIEVLESINKREGEDSFDNHVLKARIQSLYWELEGMLKRKKLDKEISLLIFTKESDYDNLVKAFSMINTHMDAIRLTRIDTRNVVDRTRVENVNRNAHI